MIDLLKLTAPALAETIKLAEIRIAARHATEVAILGGILLDNSLIGKLDELKVEHFLDPRHREVYRVAVELWCSGETVDPVTIDDETGADITLSYLAELISATGTTDGVLEHAEVLRDLEAAN